MILGRDSCRWAAPRLPLLAGGDLAGLERRRAERHVMACASCRDRLAAHRAALVALHEAGAADREAEAAAAPSLWPALARQLRESRHEPPEPLSARLARSRGRLVAGLAAGLLAAFGGYGAWRLAHRIARVTIEITAVEPTRSTTRVTIGRPAARPPVVRSTYRRPVAETPADAGPSASTDRPEPNSLARGPQPPAGPDGRSAEPTN